MLLRPATLFGVLVLVLVFVLVVTVTLPSVLADEGDLTYRTFDVSDIIALRPSRSGPRLGPVRVHNFAEKRDEPDAEGFLSIDGIADIIRETVEPASWNEGGAFLDDRGTRLHVRNRVHVIQKVEQALLEIAAAARRRVLVTLSVFESSAEAYPEVAQGARLTDSASLELPLGVMRFLEVTNQVRYVADYEVEIAQGSNITNPVVVSDDEGVVADVVAHSMLDGQHVMLEALIQRGRFETPMRRLELSIDEECFNKPFRSEKRTSLGILELPVYETVDAHVTAVVPTGGTVSVPVVVGDRLVAVQLKVELLGPDPVSHLIEVGALTERSIPVGVGHVPEDIDYPFESPASRILYWKSYASRPVASIEETMDLMTRIVDPWYWEADGRILPVRDDLLIVQAQNDVLGHVRRFLLARQAEALRPVVLDLRAYSVADAVVAGPGRAVVTEGARLVHAGRIPTISGRWGSLRAGSTANYLADYDVEVAQEARMSDPIIGQSFDGLALNVLPRLAPGGETVAVDVQMFLADRTLEPEPFITGAQFLGPIDRVSVKRVVVDTTIRVPVGGTYVLDAGPDPADESRRLAVEIRVTVP